MKIIVDNFATLGIEQCIMKVLPDTMSPEKILILPDDAVTFLASETEERMLERKRAQIKLESLEAGLHTLNRLRRQSSQGECRPGGMRPQHIDLNLLL